MEMQMVTSTAPASDKRKRLLGLSDEGVKFEAALRKEQVKLLQRVFAEAGAEAVDGWLAVNAALGQTLI
jgi:DNA-binding MarR family transcriptional regulator